MNRVIGHLDLDYFYAQVEESEDPSLRTRPVIVCVFSGRTEDSGVVSTSNYIARELGVHSGMPIVQAKRKLAGKDPAVIRMEHEKYEVVSGRIMETVARQVDLLEPTGIDEAFFDITLASDGDYQAARSRAEQIKESILKHENLTCSIGIGRSKVVAKLGSDLSKPNGLKVIPPDDTEAFLAPLQVDKLYGVGPKTAAVLNQANIRLVSEIAKANPQELEKLFGRKLAGYLLRASTGTDEDPVRPGLEPTQFGRIVTLKSDTKDPAEMVSQISNGIDYVGDKLKAARKSFRTLTAIGILTDLSTRTRSKTFESPMSDSSAIKDNLFDLFEGLASTSARDFRRVGFRVSGLSDATDQSSLSEFVQPAG